MKKEGQCGMSRRNSMTEKEVQGGWMRNGMLVRDGAAELWEEEEPTGWRRRVGWLEEKDQRRVGEELRRSQSRVGAE